MTLPHLSVSRSRRDRPCPLLKTEDSETIAILFAVSGRREAQERAEIIAARCNLLGEHGDALVSLLAAVARNPALPPWQCQEAALLGLAVWAALGEREAAEEPESSGDRAVQR